MMHHDLRCREPGNPLETSIFHTVFPQVWKTAGGEPDRDGRRG
jgi:hypothetical protein